MTGDPLPTATQYATFLEPLPQAMQDHHLIPEIILMDHNALFPRFGIYSVSTTIGIDWTIVSKSSAKMASPT
jgi:hypothetical protein